MSYFREKYTTLKEPKTDLSKGKGVFVHCPKCKQPLFKDRLEGNLFICYACDYHIRLNARKRIELLLDKNSFKEEFQEIISGDPLNFKGEGVGYKEKLKEAQKKTGNGDAVICGYGKILSKEIVISVMDFTFMGGSMGSVVGEKIYRSILLAYKKKVPLIIVSSSGGARMQEGLLSLMQMAKTSIALNKFGEIKKPFISILTDPTTGGVSASFSHLGDFNIAEEGALIGFAGPRVIEQTINQKLPVGFQSSEFLRDHGFLDMVVHRRYLREKVSKILSYF